MAEIHVEAKKKTTPIWFWVILFLIILGALGAYIMFRDDKTPTTNTGTQSSLPEQKTELVQVYNA